MALSQLVVLVLRLYGPCDNVTYGNIALFLATAGLMGWLLYIRRHDSVFGTRRKRTENGGIKGGDSYENS
jgi:hypothetical protein